MARFHCSTRLSPELLNAAAMPPTDEPATLPKPTFKPETDSTPERERPYLVICWDDPVNLMNYVVHVFQQIFGWDRKLAEKKMLEVHEEGRSILARESYERAEFYVHQLQSYSLHATLEPDES